MSLMASLDEQRERVEKIRREFGDEAAAIEERKQTKVLKDMAVGIVGGFVMGGPIGAIVGGLTSLFKSQPE